MGRQVWPFGLVAVAAGVVVGVLGLRGAPPDWLHAPTHGMLEGSPARSHALLLAALLLLLGWGLVRRRVVALGVVVLMLADVSLNLRHTEYGLLFLGAAGGLALCYSGFPGVPEPGQVVTALRNGALTLVAALLFGFAAHHGWVSRLDWGTALLVIVLVALGTVLRAAQAPAPADEGERARIRAMVARRGADTLAPFALRSDKTYLFSADGSAAVGYRVLLGVAVVGGDPIGDPAAFGDVTTRFLALCDRRGWRPAVLGARGDRVGLWSAYGMKSIAIGDEVVLDVGPFGLATRKMRNVRQAVRRTYNAGVRTSVVPAAELPSALRTEMAALSAKWLGSNRERGFSMILDGLFDGRRPEGLFVLAFDEADHVVGFQRYLPCGDASGDWALSLDVMRRERGGLNGLNERMIVDIVEYAREHGVGRVSLNFAAFRSMLERGAERGPVEQVGYRLLHLLDPLIQVESLYLFNAKFRPGYVSRNVVLGSWFALPTVLLALLGLEFALPYDRRHAVPVVASAPVEQDHPDDLPVGELLSSHWSGGAHGQPPNYH